MRTRAIKYVVDGFIVSARQTLCRQPAARGRWCAWQCEKEPTRAPRMLEVPASVESARSVDHDNARFVLRRVSVKSFAARTSTTFVAGSPGRSDSDFEKGWESFLVFMTHLVRSGLHCS